ncbi:MAG: hypothetical protein KAV18_01215 [Candidatus Omnitrophica bacterium]|nr:hypothetical protein [Candidatus Omnitrophota bacterium]
MDRKIWIILSLLMATGSAALGAEPAQVVWWEIKTRGRRPSAAMRKTGHPGAVSDTSRTSRAKHPDAASGASKKISPRVKHPGAVSDTGKTSRVAKKPPVAAPTSRRGMMAAMGSSKTLLLRWGRFPLAGAKKSILGRPVTVNNAKAWIRSPDGAISSADLYPERNTIALKCPAEKDSAQFSGLYIVGVHLNAGVMDFDADGIKERVHFYSNRFVRHYKRDGVRGKSQDVFFRDAEKMALEIGPFIPDSEIGGKRWANQTSLKEHKMQVLYKGRPLANAEVTVLTESGWKKTVTTDSLGIISITPLENKLKSKQARMPAEKYLYVVVHKESLAGEYNGDKYASEYHCASLWMDVRMPPPEWKSKIKGFNLLTISGMGFLILVVTLVIYRKKKLDKETMVKFDKYKIRKD